MNGWVVADSGIFIAIILTESYTPQAQALVRYWSQQGIQIAAPELFHYEIVVIAQDLKWVKWVNGFSPQ